MRAGKYFFQRIQRARPNISKHDPEGSQRQRRQRMLLGVTMHRLIQCSGIKSFFRFAVARAAEAFSGLSTLFMLPETGGGKSRRRLRPP